MNKNRIEQLAAMLETEAAIKLAKAAWLREDHLEIGRCLSRVEEASKRAAACTFESEYALAVGAEPTVPEGD